MTDWAYPESFKSLSLVAEWVSVVSVICCVFLLISWAALPVEKTHRHYLSICLTVAVAIMNVSRQRSLPPIASVSSCPFLLPYVLGFGLTLRNSLDSSFL